MADPVFTFCEEGSSEGSAVEYDSGNPIQLLNAAKGIPSAAVVVDLWNDRDGAAGSDTASSPSVFALNDDDISAVFAGTGSNGNISMLECRSTLASPGIPADNQTSWTPISNISALNIGSIPAGKKRVLEFRLNPPVDAPTLTVKNFLIAATP